MVDEAFVDDPLADTNVWDRTIELSELNNRVEDTFLSEGLNINNVLGYNVSDDTKLDIVHEPVLPPIKEELPDLKDYIDDNEDIQNSQEIKSEPLEGVHTDNRIEISDYLENDDVVVQKEIIYVNCMRTDHISGVTSTELNKLDCGILCSHCETCNEDYKWYCYKCSMLSYILDQSIIDRSEDRAKKTVPTFLTIKKALLGHVGVYSLKYIPKNVKFGPFEGLDPIQTTSGCAWKLKYGVLTVAPDNVNRSNWMQYVDSAKLSAEQNLTIFQQDGKLYFRSSRQINPGDELLVYYGDTLNAGGSDVQSYCYPAAESHMETVYACTYCCLGFSSEVYLHKHKTVCPNTENKDMTKGSVQCAFCKIYLDMRENSEYHMRHCCVKYTWSRAARQTNSQVTPTFTRIQPATSPFRNNSIKIFQEYIENASNKNYLLTERVKCDNSDISSSTTENGDDRVKECTSNNSFQYTLRSSSSDNANNAKNLSSPKWPFKTQRKENLRRHLVRRHDNVNHFQCNTCEILFANVVSLKSHAKTHDVDYDPKKEYKCDECAYETDTKCSLTEHLRVTHPESTDNSKMCKCPQCNFQSKYKSHLRHHIVRHDNVKSFQCEICGVQFTDFVSLKSHKKTQHGDIGAEKQHKCGLCSYETHIKYSLTEHIKYIHRENPEVYKYSRLNFQSRYKHYLRCHLIRHDIVKTYKCKICRAQFGEIKILRQHRKTEHAEEFSESAEIHQCSQCSFQTKSVQYLKAHSNVHKEKRFSCPVCDKKLSRRSHLNAHLNYVHAINGTSEKKHKCSKCNYQTNYQHSLKMHLRIHDNSKPHECKLCNTWFRQSQHLKTHMKYKHKESMQA